MYHERLTGVDPKSLSPEEEREIIRSSFATTVRTMPDMVYCKLPNIPRLRRRLILMSGAARRYLFVLRDNSTHEAKTAPVHPEDIKAVKELLGIDQEPAWYDVSVE